MRWFSIVRTHIFFFKDVSPPGLTMSYFSRLLFCSVNVFYHVGQEQQSATSASHLDAERARQEREFKIGSIGFSDSLGILCASIIAVPTEVQLCKAQVRRGKMLCTKL